jgi:hypothetical protein
MYTLYIERTKSNAITQAEWEQAVSKHSNLKLADAVKEFTNPKTGEKIKFAAKPNEIDTQVIDSKGAVFATIRYANGRASFPAVGDTNLVNNPLRVAVASLAKQLKAQVVGDEGEVYDW